MNDYQIISNFKDGDIAEGVLTFLMFPMEWHVKNFKSMDFFPFLMCFLALLVWMVPAGFTLIAASPLILIYRLSKKMRMHYKVKQLQRVETREFMRRKVDDALEITFTYK